MALPRLLDSQAWCVLRPKSEAGHAALREFCKAPLVTEIFMESCKAAPLVETWIAQGLRIRFN